MEKSNWFKAKPWKYERANSNAVKVGVVEMGAMNPVRVQSMANTSTHNVEASVAQAIEIIQAGGELVRFTVINKTDAEALKEIKQSLLDKGFSTPIVADVHFNPALADIAARYIDKVRINPGNYLDKRATFQQVEFSDDEYAEELERLKKRFLSFLEICTENNTAIRIGTNHGSLSDRIMSRYGDTPKGMVEATMEFLRICKDVNFNHVLVSLKSSNTRVMVQAYRLLFKQMADENMCFPLHLGVTEAGSEQEGRIKSAVGIGTLMNDGLGDTIRVSLTEHPAKEIPVAEKLVRHFEKLANHAAINYESEPTYNPFDFQKREVRIDDFSTPRVVADLSGEGEVTRDKLEGIGFTFNTETKTIERGDIAPDVVYTGEYLFPFKSPEGTSILTDSNYWQAQTDAFPIFSWVEYLTATQKSEKQNWVHMQLSDLNSQAIELIKNDSTIVLVVFSYHANASMEQRAFINKLQKNNCKVPVLIQKSYSEPALEDFQLKAAADTGLFFVDGLSNGLWLKNTFKKSAMEPVETAFAILQAGRSRVTKTEYISCPGCGRTLFDLEQTLAKVKKETSHLKGLKIAVMGCIVNGPGEMADADYGYVGAGAGKVSLYKGKEVVQRNIEVDNAIEVLLNFIEEDLKQTS